VRAESLPLAAQPPPVLRVVGWFVSVLMIAAALLPLVPKLFASSPVPMTLEIGGDLDRVNADTVRRTVAGRLNGNFYDLDLAGIKQAVEALPWVARARVERAWPASLRVHVWEHRAIARWGEKSLLSSEDVVFTPVPLPLDLTALPRLAGPDGQQAAVRQAFSALRAELADTPFVPAHLIQNLRGEWTAYTADGLELRLGRGAPTAAVAVLAGPVRSALEGRLQEVTYVDLHYINGFAVGWRQPVGGDARSPGDSAEDRDD
jgi:cell division protein FtsQ